MTEHDDRASAAGTFFLTRRQFIQWTAAACAGWAYGAPVLAGPPALADPVARYPIDPDVRTTVDRMLAFPATRSPGLRMNELNQVARYDALGYGQWSWGAGLPMVRRDDLVPAGAGRAPGTRSTRLLRFFTISDIHITDKEAPNQLAYLQQIEPAAGNNTSIYSPVMLYTTHVLDAAVQTVNALHRRDPFDFGLSLGDTCNSTSWNELRWYLDVIDGRTITPSSGAHAGAATIDYQRPYRAAGLDRSIPWYQVMGNHDHFFIGSFPVDADPSLGLRAAYVADTVWTVPDVLAPNLATFPVLFDSRRLKESPRYYTGRLDGTSRYGALVAAGRADDPAYAAGAPKIVADPDRRALTRAEWVREFFATTTLPAGHGFALVDPRQAARSPGFTCYSFVPRADVPLKVIVLDDTQSEHDGSHDIHGHGYLDQARWEWLQAELAAGQAADQLMIVAAHIPIGVSAIGSETEWWNETADIAPEHRNAVSLPALVAALWRTPNLLLWVAGHRHVNAVKAFASPDPAAPEQGFWQVETSSLRDFPQQFRTFDIRGNDDGTVSIVTTNVDPAVREGSPAAASRRVAIAVQQIVGNDLRVNNPNVATVALPHGKVAVPTMDPSRPQVDAPRTPDPSIQYVDLAHPARGAPVPVHGSYNGELVKVLSPRMTALLKARLGAG